MNLPAPGAAPNGRPHNISAWTLRHRPFVIFLLVLVTLFGVMSYPHLPQSEDPPFTFKVMVIRTQWPGATALQVQNLVTDKIARTLQATPDIDFLRSYSRPGTSTVFFTIKDAAPAAAVPRTWYQVRKKIGDMAYQLPPGVQGPFFNDEFGDVYTNIYALSGQDFSPAELRDQADTLRVVLLKVPGVAKIDYFGDPEQKIYVDISNAHIARLGITAAEIGQTINAQNAVASAGTVETRDDRIEIHPSGQYADVAALGNTLLKTRDGRLVRLGDIAKITRGYADPPASTMHFSNQSAGHPALGIGITMQKGTNVVQLGKDLQKAIAGLRAQLPVGLTLDTVTNMPDTVSHSVDDFVRAVAEAVVIVLLVSLVSLGWRTGMVVVLSIPLVLAATALGMRFFDIGLHKVSLGTLVLALGLLVDDAIIAVEMMAVKLEQGWERSRAAAFAYTSTAFPMLTGTLVTVAGFLPIALAQSSTGEYTRSIFEVSALALLLSWLSAVIVVPLLGFYLLRQKRHNRPADAAALHGQQAGPFEDTTQGGGQEHANDVGDVSAGDHLNERSHAVDDHGEEQALGTLYQSRFYQRLARAIVFCVARRWWVLSATVLLFGLALASFTWVPKQFFPGSNRPELLIDLKLPENASYAATFGEVEKMAGVLKDRPEIDHYASFIGSGAPRFFLSLDQQLEQPNTAQFLVTTRSVVDREKLASALEPVLKRDFSGLRTRLTRLENGPPIGFPVQFRVSGPNIKTVRRYAGDVANIVRADARALDVQLDWDEPGSRSMQFQVDQAKARAANMRSKDIADFIAMTLGGTTVSQLRDNDKLISIDLRARPTSIEPFGKTEPNGANEAKNKATDNTTYRATNKADEPDKADSNALNDIANPADLIHLAIPTAAGPVPLGSLGHFEYGLAYGVIWERDRQPTITVQADIRANAQAIDVTTAVDQRLNTLRATLPTGYRIVAGGAVEENAKAQQSILAQMPLMAVVVLILLMAQLQRFSLVVIVVLTAPLGLIGVIAALLMFDQPFGFVAMLGVIAMFGIIMRNSVILVDQIERDIASGQPRLDAIVGASVRRFRPITLTAAAAVLALIPLLRNSFFSPMATALMGGITLATLLTLFFLPALYATWFRVAANETTERFKS